MDEAAIERFIKLTESNQDDPEVQYQIALCYLNGEGVEQDGQMAQELLKQAAEQGHEAAKALLHSHTITSESTDSSSTPQNQGGLNLLEICSAAEDGDVEAQYQAACWFMNSDVPGSASEVERYLIMAADNGHGMASLLLAKRRLKEGNNEKAVDLLRNAADCGIGEAATLLGECYANGIGVEVDSQQAEAYLSQGAALSGSEAMLDLAFRYTIGDGVPTMPGKAMSLVKSVQNAGIADAYDRYTHMCQEYQQKQEALAAQKEKERQNEEARQVELKKLAEEAHQAELKKLAEEQAHQEALRHQADEQKQAKKIIQLIKTPKVIIPAILMILIIILAVALSSSSKNRGTTNDTASSSGTVTAAAETDAENEQAETIDEVTANEEDDATGNAENTGEEAETIETQNSEKVEGAVEELTAEVGSYVVTTSNYEPLSFLSTNSTIPYNGIVYASEFKEVSGNTQAFVRYGEVEGWVLFDSLSWLDTEDRTISVDDTCYINFESGYLREEADSSSSVVSVGTFWDYIYYGSQVTVTEQSGAWCKVNYGEYESWIETENLGKFLDGFQYKTSNSEDDAVELMESRDTESETLEEIPNGRILDVQYYEGGWGVVAYNGTTGFVQMCYMTPVSSD